MSPPLDRYRVPPSGPFAQPDGDVSNGLPIALLRCETDVNIVLTDVSGPQSATFEPKNGTIVVPEATPGGGAIGYVMDVKASFLNRKGLTSTNARVDVTVEIWNNTTGAWIEAGILADVFFSIPKNQSAVVGGDPSVGITAGEYTKGRITLAANAGNTATGDLAGLFASDDPRVDIALYKGVAP